MLLFTLKITVSTSKGNSKNNLSNMTRPLYDNKTNLIDIQDLSLPQTFIK